MCTWHTSSAVVGKRRGFLDDKYTVRSYLREKKNLIKEKQERTRHILQNPV
jgi:hypothetical protein